MIKRVTKFYQYLQISFLFLELFWKMKRNWNSKSKINYPTFREKLENFNEHFFNSKATESHNKRVSKFEHNSQILFINF